MDIDKRMIEAMKKRKNDEFGLGKGRKYLGIDIAKIRSKIGYRGIDLADDVSIDEETIKKIKVYKYYTTKDATSVLFNIHGGGFYGGSCLVMQYCNKYVAKYSKSHIYAIEYTLAPESKYPDTINEIYEVIKEIMKRYENEKFFISGDSAGAHLAMDVVLKMPSLFSYVFLYYPVTSLKLRKDWKIEQYKLVEPCMYAKAIINMLYQSTKLIQKLYLPVNYKENSKFFDFKNIAVQEMDKLPKILVFKAEFDYFNLDITEFVDKYNIECIEYKGMAHGFLELLGYLDEAKNVLDTTISRIKEV